jgi:hypothetical protein
MGCLHGSSMTNQLQLLGSKGAPASRNGKMLPQILRNLLSAVMVDCYNPSDGAGPSSASFFEPNTGSPKGDHMFSRSILKMLLLATILLAIVTSATAAAPPNEAAQSSVGSIHTYLMPDLSLKSAFTTPVVLPSGTGFRKTCRCSCGTAPCATDADCGGGIGSCSAFISCCAKGDKTLSFSGVDKSSRKTELPAFKGSCN